MGVAGRTESKVLPGVLADIGDGSHFCAFYESKDDLIDLVLPFFMGGASRNELCVWMTPDSVNAQDAALHARLALIESGIELYPGREFYVKESRFESGRVMRFWNEKLQQALDAGRSGMRTSGDSFWLHAGVWKAFLDYEADLTKAIADKPMAVLCTYPLSVSKAGDIFEVACAHHIAIAKRKRRWEVIKGWGIAEAPHTAHQKRFEALEAANRILSLSPRERQVLDGLAEGRANKAIADELGISVRTVEVHRARLLDRLNVRTTAEAVRMATLASLITPAQ